MHLEGFQGHLLEENYKRQKKHERKELRNKQARNVFSWSLQWTWNNSKWGGIWDLKSLNWCRVWNPISLDIAPFRIFPQLTISQSHCWPDNSSRCAKENPRDEVQHCTPRSCSLYALDKSDKLISAARSVCWTNINDSNIYQRRFWEWKRQWSISKLKPSAIRATWLSKRWLSTASTLCLLWGVCWAIRLGQKVEFLGWPRDSMLSSMI